MTSTLLATGRRVEDLPDLLTVDELAEFLQVPTQTVYYWRVQGEAPPAIKLGKYVRFPKRELSEWLQERQSSASNER